MQELGCQPRADAFTAAIQAAYKSGKVSCRNNKQKG
jgi:hypothetical protein